MTTSRLSNYDKLARVSTLPNYLDTFFGILITSPWAVPLTSLGSASATPDILAAIHRHHGIIRAQAFAQNLLPANTTNTTLPAGRHRVNTTDDMFFYPATAFSPPGEGMRRVVQDATSTRILQALLGAAMVLVVLGWVFLKETDVLPRSPNSVASVVALVAGGGLLEGSAGEKGGVEKGDFIEGGDSDREGGESGSGSDGGEDGMRREGVRFWMGWGTVTDWEGRENGGGENEAGVSRFGIFTVREEEVIGGKEGKARLMGS